MREHAIEQRGRESRASRTLRHVHAPEDAFVPDLRARRHEQARDARKRAVAGEAAEYRVIRDARTKPFERLHVLVIPGSAEGRGMTLQAFEADVAKRRGI